MFCVFFFKQKTAYEMRISDWSSDVCSSDLAAEAKYLRTGWSPLKQVGAPQRYATPLHCSSLKCGIAADQFFSLSTSLLAPIQGIMARSLAPRSEEHTSELQSLMRTSYAVFCLKKIITILVTIVFTCDHF